MGTSTSMDIMMKCLSYLIFHYILALTSLTYKWEQGHTYYLMKIPIISALLIRNHLSSEIILHHFVYDWNRTIT